MLTMARLQFLLFPDIPEVAAAAGAMALVRPGGWIRDARGDRGGKKA
jgi:AICAR transformylase/IMP cyclohydrolase PurH